MCSDTVCRSCVVKGVKMHCLGEELQDIFEKLTSTKVNSGDGLPMQVCFICYSQLQRCKKFSEIALRSQQLLRDRLYSDISQDIEPFKLLNLQVVENLSITVADTNHNISEIPEEQHANNLMCFKERPDVVKEVVEVKCLVDCDDTKIALAQVEAEYNTNEKIDEETTYSNIFSEHELPRKPFTCRKCKKEFFKSKKLIEHMKDCFADFQCKFCKATFSSMATLKDHMFIHYKDDEIEETFACDFCTMVFKNRARLTAHMNVHTIDKKYTCEICGKTFVRKGSFKIHKVLHEGTKAFVCGVCGKAFSTKGVLKLHNRCHTGERPYQCNICGYKFAVKSCLMKHVQKLHIEVKPFQCSLCYVSFNQEVALTSHMRMHTADRFYKCEKCKKTFISASRLKEHLGVHSEDRPFKCPTCGKGFRKSIYLKRHFRTIKCKVTSVFPEISKS